MTRDMYGMALVPGVNVDKISVESGLAEAVKIGYDSAEDEMVVVYALMRWARGEEDGAQRTMLSHGIDLTSIYRIVAAARSAAEQE
jgi:hypothetical protein